MMPLSQTHSVRFVPCPPVVLMCRNDNNSGMTFVSGVEDYGVSEDLNVVAGTALASKPKPFHGNSSKRTTADAPSFSTF